MFRSRRLTSRYRSGPMRWRKLLLCHSSFRVAEIVTAPLFFPCARPELRIEAIFGLEDFQLNPLRFVAVLPSLKVPVAVNFSDVPFAILGFAGLIVINVRCAIETVN